MAVLVNLLRFSLIKTKTVDSVLNSVAFILNNFEFENNQIHINNDDNK